MKKSILVFAIGAFLFTSCNDGSSSEEESEKKADYTEGEGKAAEKLCSCLEGMDMEDPTSAMNAASCLMDIAEDEDMQTASEEGVKKAMSQICPDEAKVFDELTGK